MKLLSNLDPHKTALVVIDKQAGYFDRKLVQGRKKDLPEDAEQVLETIDTLIEKARMFGIEVIWTKMVEDTEVSPKVTSTIMKSDPDKIYSISRPGTESFKIFGRVTPLQDEKVLTKYYYNAFAKTDLAQYLRQREIEAVILVGGYAPRCVLSTAVGANGEDLYVIIVEDAVTYQTNTSGEIPGLFFFTKTLLGSTTSSNELIQFWKN